MKRYSSFLDLPDYPRLFSQQGLLTSQDMLKAWEKRTRNRIKEEALEALHRANLLVPVLRLKKPLAAAVREAKVREISPHGLLMFDMNTPELLEEARSDGRLVDPRVEGFIPWSRSRRRDGEFTSRTAEHLYAWSQLEQIDHLERITRNMRSLRNPGGGYRYAVAPKDEEFYGGRFPVSVHLLLAVIDHVYRPRIMGRLTLGRGGEDEWRRWVSQFDPARTLRRLSLRQDSLPEKADRFLTRANHLDPAKDWWPLMRLARPKMWKNLRGEALQALDNRIVGEMLLLLHEDLVRGGKVPPLDPIDEHSWEPRRERITASAGDLDRHLTRFGLSPHPAVVLAIEGQTEEEILPHVFDALGFHPTPSQLQVIRLPGVDSDVGLLASYAAVPSVGEAVRGKGVLLDRPLTHVVVAVDPEGRYRTKEGCEHRRQQIINKLLERLSPEHRTPAIRKQLEPLVEIHVWGDLPFEFAHFADGEIARALDRAYRRKFGQAPTHRTSAAEVRQARANRPDIGRIRNGRRLSKVSVAQELWPVLDRKIASAIAAGNPSSVPIAGVALRVAELIQRISRRTFMLLTEMEGEPSERD